MREEARAGSGSKDLGTDRRFMRRGGATKDAEAEK